MATTQNPFDIGPQRQTQTPPLPGAAAPAPARPQYTQEQMQSAIRQRRSEGMTDDQIADIGRNLGIGYEDFAQAMTAVDPSYAPNWRDGTGTWVQRATTLARVGAPPGSASAAPVAGPNGGIIASQTGLPGGNTYDASLATSAGYTPERMQTATWNVDRNQLVQNQLNDIIAADGPLAQQARTAALQGMGARGLINSSMAVGAAQDAVVRSALPIAQADAATFGNAAQFNAASENTTRANNMNAGNRALEFGANASNTASLANSQQINDARRFNATSVNQSQMAGADRDFERWKTEYSGNLQRWLADKDESTRLAITRLDGQIKQQLADVEARFKVQMQQSQSSAALYADTISSISRIMTDPNMDAGAKQNMINQLMTSMQNGLRLQSAISNIPGLDDILSQIGNPAPPASTAPVTPAPAAPGVRPPGGSTDLRDGGGG